MLFLVVGSIRRSDRLIPRREHDGTFECDVYIARSIFPCRFFFPAFLLLRAASRCLRWHIEFVIFRTRMLETPGVSTLPMTTRIVLWTGEVNEIFFV